MNRPAFSLRRFFRRTLILAHRFVFGTLLVMVAVIALSVYGGLTWAKHKFSQGWTLGPVGIQAQQVKVAWDLSLRAQSLKIRAPGLVASATSMRLRPVLSNNLFAVYPALRLSLEKLDLEILPKPNSGPPAKPHFPSLRWPMPWKAEIGRLHWQEKGKTQIELQNIQLESRGLLGAQAKALIFAEHGDWGKGLPTPLRKGVKSEISARWKGDYLGYRLLLRSVEGDTLRLKGRRLRKDLALATDSLFLALAHPSQYWQNPDSAPEVVRNSRRLGAQFSLQTYPNPLYSARIWGHTDSLPLAGSVDWEAQGHGGLKRAWLKITAATAYGGRAVMQAEMPWKPSDSLDKAPAEAANVYGALARLRPQEAHFTGQAENLLLDVGGEIIPGNLTFHQGVFIPGQIATTRVLSREGTDLQLAFYPRKAWLLAFQGDVGQKEPWAHAWTDTHVVFKAAQIKGHVHQQGVLAQANFQEVRAYGARADSVVCWNTVTWENYRLDSTRITDLGKTWLGRGQVTWKKNKRKLPQGAQLWFTLEHPEFGHAYYAMPRPGIMEARAKALSPHQAPYPPLFFLSAFEPKVTGEFHWNFMTQKGNVDAQALVSKGGKTVNAHAEGAWDEDELEVRQATLRGENMDLSLGAKVSMEGKPFYEVLRARIADFRSVRVQSGGLDVPGWLDRLGVQTPLRSGRLQGNLMFSPEKGMEGGVELRGLVFRKQPDHLRFGTLTLRGLGDTLEAAMASQSPQVPYLNAWVRLKALQLFSADPDFLLDATVRDSLLLAGRASLNRAGRLSGALDITGAVELPAQAGHLRQVHWLSSFDWPLRSGLAGLSGESHAFQGTFIPNGLPAQSFIGRLDADKGLITLNPLRFHATDGKQFEARANYAVQTKALDFQLQGQAFAMSLGGRGSLDFRDVQIAGSMNPGAFKVKADAAALAFHYRKGAILAQGKIENVTAGYTQTTQAGAVHQAPPLVQAKGTLVQSLFRHKIGAEELKAFMRGMMRANKPKAASGGGGGAARARPMEIAMQIDTRGQDNRIETEVARLAFAGDVSAKGVQPFLLLNGSVTSLKGEIGQKSQAYDLRDLELKWQNATPAEGAIGMEGVKKIFADCEVDTKKTCHVSIRFEGRIDEAHFTYETDCGGDQGEAIKPTAIINSISRGCYSGDLSGGESQGDYGKTLVNFLTPVVNDRLTTVIKRGTLGWIRSAQLSGVSALVGGENAQSGIDEPVALNLESKEKYRMRLLGRAGYLPSSKQSNPYDFKIAGQLRPPLDTLVSDSLWKGRLKDRVAAEMGVETRPEENNVNVERDVRWQAGLRYKYQFWNLW